MSVFQVPATSLFSSDKYCNSRAQIVDVVVVVVVLVIVVAVLIVVE